MDVFIQVTRDGGATFDNLGTGGRSTATTTRCGSTPTDGSHLIAGTDAGLYETFDEGTTWRHFPNLPVSQFYKVALSNAEPFYDILGGAQDLGTLHGPVRTTNVEGVRNQDWYVPMGADGYGVAIDPTDPDILYDGDPGGEPVPVRSAQRRSAAHPAAAGAGRPARAMELGLPDPHQPARLQSTLLRLRSDSGEATTAVTRGRR